MNIAWSKIMPACHIWPRLCCWHGVFTEAEATASWQHHLCGPWKILVEQDCQPISWREKTNLLVDNHKLSPFDDVLTTINPFVGWWYYQISNHQPNNRYVCVYKIVLYIHVYIYIYLHHLVIKSFKSHHFPRSKSSQSFVDQPGIGRTTIPFWQQNLPIISSQFVRLCLAKFKRCRSPSSWFSMCKHSPGVW